MIRMKTCEVCEGKGIIIAEERTACPTCKGSGMVDDTEEKKRQLLREVMESYPEASTPSLLCVKWDYKNMVFKFEEYFEESYGTYYTVTEDDLLKGLDKFLAICNAGNYHNNSFPNGYEDAGNWDAIDVDALVQCTIFGEIIYG